jgi:hypothetical protein
MPLITGNFFALEARQRKLMGHDAGTAASVHKLSSWAPAPYQSTPRYSKHASQLLQVATFSEAFAPCECVFAGTEHKQKQMQEQKAMLRSSLL